MSMRTRNTTEIHQAACGAPWQLQLIHVDSKLINFENANYHDPLMALRFVSLVAGGTGLTSKVTQGFGRFSYHE